MYTAMGTSKRCWCNCIDSFSSWDSYFGTGRNCKNTWEGWTDNNSDDIDCIDIYCYYRNTKLQ